MRYEFRIWPGDATPFIEDMQTVFAYNGREKRTDTYLLAPDRNDLLPKIRGADQLDIKQCLSVDSSGVEKWEVIVAETFPVSPGTKNWLREMFPGLQKSQAAFRNVGDFLEAVSGAAEIYTVEKSRRLYCCNQCKAEVTRVTVNASSFNTVALECDDREMLKRFMHKLNFNGYRNIHYGVALRELYLEAPYSRLYDAQDKRRFDNPGRVGW
ncbi:hypothetical protein [Hyphococcus sp.]|uniref:hypothetical protein n=1 Tax=Hyphococcus sp. TaxID=2038636 RepID=UPI003CCC0695